MRGNPVLQLAALNENDPTEARRLLMEAYGLTQLNFNDALEDFERSIELGICANGSDVSVDLETAELVALLLKDRRLPHGHPTLSRSERDRNGAAVSLARQLKKQKIAAEIPRGRAEEEAAQEAAAFAGPYGCTLAWTTIQARMKRRDRSKKGRPPVRKGDAKPRV